MAKIFSTIVKNTNTLPTQLISASIAAVYDNSAVNVTNTNTKTLINLRTVSPALQIQPIQVYKRIEEIYKMFNSSPVTQSVQFNNTANSLLLPSSYTRTRPTGLYSAFKSYEPTIPAVPAKNFTLLEITPTANINASNFETFDAVSQGVSGSSAAVRPEPTDVILQDSRAFPIVSGERDIYRVTRFLGTAEGTYFLGLQARLQAGNTFGQSRLYNIASVRNQAINYRVATLFRPLQRTSRISYNNYTNQEELWGRVQKETVIDVQTMIRKKYVDGRIVLNRPDALSEFAATQLGQAFRNLAARTRVPRFLRRIVGLPAGASFEQFFNEWNTVTTGIQAILNSVATQDPTLLRDQTVYDGLYKANIWPVMQEYQTNSKIRNFHLEKAAYLSRAQASISQSKGIQINNLNKSMDAYGITDPLNDYRSSVDFTEIVRTSVPETQFNGVITSRYIQDITNLTTDAQGNAQGILDSKILENESTDSATDIVLLRFIVPSVYDNGIDFRAFIEDLNHSAKGQFEDVKYVGRPERFVTYKGMTRNLTFSMYLVAFSENEVDTIWTRANMLNKLVYPITSRGGFMTPPLVRLTIGNMIVDQPGYVESIDMRFANIPWDIDRELPMAIKLNMNYNILEKDYITQDGTNPREFVQLFNQATRPVPPPPPPNTSPANTPPNTAATTPRNNATNTPPSNANPPQNNGDRQGGYEGDQQRIIDTYKATFPNATQQDICDALNYLVDESFRYVSPCR